MKWACPARESVVRQQNQGKEKVWNQGEKGQGLTHNDEHKKKEVGETGSESLNAQRQNNQRKKIKRSRYALVRGKKLGRRAAGSKPGRQPSDQKRANLGVTSNTNSTGIEFTAEP